MTIDNAVFLFAGSILLVTSALGFLHSEYWFFFAVFVGLNMIQSTFTGFCPAAIVFKRLGLRPGCAFK